ncbi:MAG TPA: glycosyltransferase family 2 protein [candidate division Zixibacteria bacterium]|nr:glycosyltransferase family 2 protein [candidate division Zixibacteria bacterium]
MISVVILTFNSELTIAQTLASARQVSDDIHILDSYSTDRTLEIAREFGCNIVQHPFEHYGAQRNWAIGNLKLRYEWHLHLDADEFLSDELIEKLNALKRSFPSDVNGYFIPRLTRFLGRDLRHGGHYPIWHMRLFRSGKGGCENRRYDQHFILTGRGERIHAPMVDDNRMSLREWTERHNRWADAEVQEILSPTVEGLIQPKLGGTPMQTKRALRGLYARGPLFMRAFLLFFYRYFLRLGFLDGAPGLIYNVLQTFWYRFLIDAKLYERSREKETVALSKAQAR